MSDAVQLPIPAKLAPLFTAVGKRYRCSHGGRGSAKTRTFALMTAVKAYQSMMNGESGVILCAREFMNSLEESSMQEVKQAILSVPWLASNFDIGEKYIRTIDKSVTYVFAGLRHNLDSIKSKARILLCWVDEAESVSEIAWQKLSPTVREEGSEIWVTWNPERDGSATDKRFRKEAGDDCITVEMNYTDNPWFPDVLEGERLNDQRRLDPATYAWVWEGAYLENSDKQVLAGKYRIADFSDELWKEAVAANNEASLKPITEALAGIQANQKTLSDSLTANSRAEEKTKRDAVAAVHGEIVANALSGEALDAIFKSLGEAAPLGTNSAKNPPVTGAPDPAAYFGGAA